jgi:starch-binding outer membrane protein, SusD/RagB family
MNNKNIFRALRPACKVLSLAWMILVASSCSDSFLDVVPQDRIDKTTFYATDDELLIGVNGVYASLRGDYGNLNLFTMREARSDNGQLNPNGQSEQISLDSFNETSGNLLVLDGWTNMYRTISLANAVIEKGPGAEGDEAIIARAIGEAKFIRALTNFQLVVLWGPVPLRTTITNVEDAAAPNAAVDQIYNQIVTDLNDAAGVLPEGYAGGLENEKGRATKYAALALLGKVELQRGNNAAAESALRQVLGKYTLLDNYADIFKAGNDNTAETIFEINFNPANQTGLGFPANLIYQSEMTRLGVKASGTTSPAVIPTNSLMEEYEDGDERLAATITIAVAEQKPYVSKYLDLAAADQGHDINLPVIRYADVLLLLAEAIGESSESYGFINQVRDRAELGPINEATPGTFIEKVMHERRIEFAFEQQRWIDLLRLPDATVTAIMTTQLTEQQGTAVTVTANDLLFPIPKPEVDLAEGLVVQNPGY